jgi:glycosyltransferase involved in cell wall biosynthesis
LGIPCVCSNVKPYNKIIEHGFNGFLANSTEDWINYFNILKNKDTRKKIIFNAKKNILKNYTYDSLILKIDEIIKKVL